MLTELPPPPPDLMGGPGKDANKVWPTLAQLRRIASDLPGYKKNGKQHTKEVSSPAEGVPPSAPAPAPPPGEGAAAPGGGGGGGSSASKSSGKAAGGGTVAGRWRANAVEAPPQLAPPPGAKMFTLQIEPHALVPGGKRLQVAAVDLTGLRVEIGRQLGLKDLNLQVLCTLSLFTHTRQTHTIGKPSTHRVYMLSHGCWSCYLQFFDNGFDEWCALATFDDVDSGAAETKLKVTYGTRLPIGGGESKPSWQTKKKMEGSSAASRPGGGGGGGGGGSSVSTSSWMI
eukprot:COSAG02_NODE_1808_length_10843_cov_4.345867_6_plen_284_part_01